MTGGRPLTARTRFSRSVADTTTRLSVALEAHGSDGVLAVRAPAGGVGARVVIGAGAFATALVADAPPAGADASGMVLHTLLVAGLGLSALLKNSGGLVVHGVELQSTGHGLPVGGAVTLTVDYSVDVVVDVPKVGVLSVSMNEDAPMRVRNRNVGLTVDPHRSGLEMFSLDFSRADMEIEDPGCWTIQSPGSLFDILGTRSGRGSMWFEVDLRFRLDLGPVKVSGATIRVDLTAGTAGLRGLDATLEIPGVVAGRGAFQMLEGGGFAAELDVDLIPLNVATTASVLYEPHDDSFLLFLRLGVDLPGPIPLASSGLGLFGLAGSVGVNARPTAPKENEDPVAFQLAWDSSDPATSFTFAPDQLTLGVEAVIGTIPDLGFSFSAKGGLFLTVPDVAVRGALLGKLVGPRLGVSDHPPAEGAAGVAFTGAVVVDPKDAVTVGLKGTVAVPVLLTVVVPLGAHFPVSGSGHDPHDWYIHLGADGYRGNPSDGRGIGPVRAEILPQLMPSHADAYVMLRGKGITAWPRGGTLTHSDGFVLAFGFGFGYTLGIEPIVWADVHAGADILIASRPLTLAGFGQVGGSLNLGPFSLGVDAQLKFMVMAGAEPSLHARLCGHIDLFFTELEGCVEISVHDEPTRVVPIPDTHPLDDISGGAVVGDLAYLVDDRFRRLSRLPHTPEGAPTVWPDTLLHLSFAVSPKLAGGFAGGQFTGIDAYPAGLAAEPVGSDMLRYEWSLDRVALLDVTDGPEGVPVPGPLTGAWQCGRDGDLGARPQAGDLVLLTYRDDLLLDVLPDGGASLPADPLADAADRCHRNAAPTAGWAVGFGATTTGAGFTLPADPLSPDRTVSRPTAQLTQTTTLLPGRVLTKDSAALLPAVCGYRPPTRTRLPIDGLGERDFDGVLELGTITGPIRPLEALEAFGSAELALAEPLADPRLWLVVDADPGVDHSELQITDDRGQQWQRADAAKLSDGRIALRYAPKIAGDVRRVTVRIRAGFDVGVLGLGGITATARDAADQRNAAWKAQSNQLATAAATQPQPSDVTNGVGTRCLLKPDRRYRLDVETSWQGWLSTQDENGQVVPAANRGPEKSPTRSYFFATAPVRHTPALDETGLRFGEPGHLQFLHRRHDLFRPEMLARHLLGYTPAQAETDRFRDDPLQAHFSVAHIAALAAAYGFEIKLVSRRVDAPGAAGEPVELDPDWTALQNARGLNSADRRRRTVAAIGSCPLPTPGATAQGVAELAPQAWYELAVKAVSTRALVADGWLDGVAFRTSRWRNPIDMLAGIGLRAADGKATSSVAITGDVQISGLPPLTPAAADGSDAGFERAMDAMGLDGWPRQDGPRVSLLWLPPLAATADWRCGGVVVESPEPLVRPDRLELTGARLRTGPTASAARPSAA